MIYGQGSTAEQRRKNGLLTIVLRKVDLQNAKLEEGEKGGMETRKETGRKKEGRGKKNLTLSGRALAWHSGLWNPQK